MALHSTRVLEQPNAQPAPEASRAPQRNTPFTLAVMGVCIAVALLGFRSGAQAGALYGPAVGDGQWWRVLTTVFVHGGIIHLGVNMMSAWNLGRPLEWLVGTSKFVALSLASALGASLFALAFSYDAATVGASGMLLGWAGALLPIVPPAVRRSLWGSLLIIALISISPGISWQGHLGGFLFGLPMGFALRKRSNTFFATFVLLCVAAIVGMWSTVQVKAGLVSGLSL